MRFKHKPPASWDIRALDASKLSDQQAEYYYQLAKHEGALTPDYPPGSMGRLAVAGEYVRYCQSQLRKLTEVRKP